MGLHIENHFGFERRWIASAIRELPSSPLLFSADRRADAQEKLGIGVRKIEALRDWLVKLGLAEPMGPSLELTPLGTVLQSFDPSLEEPGTWWLLHSQASRPGYGVGVYSWFVHQSGLHEFSLDGLRSRLHSAHPRLSERSVRNILQALLQACTWTPLGSSLGVLVETGPDRFARRLGQDSTVPLPIFAFAVLAWAHHSGRETVDVAEITERSAPGHAFGLSLELLNAVLDRAQEAYRKEVLWVSRTAGLNSVGFHPDTQPLHLVETYYLEQIEGLEPYEALQRARTEGLSARLLAEGQQQG